MRVTQKIIFDNFMRDVNKNRSEMAEIQSNLSSGKEIRVPSQGPVNFQSSRVLEADLSKVEQFQSNISSGLRQGRLAQDTMDGVIDNLIKIKNSMVKGSSDSLGAQERESLADEVAGIRSQIVDSLNIKYGDRYLFAGTNSGNKPFNETGTGVTNNSNDKAPHVVAGDGVEIDISVTGQEIVDTPAGDIFTFLEDTENALRDNNNGQLNNLLTDADDVINHTTDLTSKLGDNINRMDFMFEQYESTKITQESDVSELVDTDYAQAFSDMQRTQVAYESAMAVHSKMFENTLLNYI
ncbi:flagellar hook-associated protein FlgL [Fodinibius salsisoli]|uniref:Flagellar hook-associated protein FlgL n=1 Tax=Fodinibius salsisoli TaxID=2820877 RepID=A0ABT3PHE7_9BACT|nr:flagellar hook-associated protein FlgL [Fodinibius salsisoli]MCW9705350.1 flagellar hook-associated protein FlgL [Fodinibius salsisoli]